MRPLSVLFLNSIAADVWGGGEKWMVAAARGLTDRGHRACCVGRSGARWLLAAREAGLPTVAMRIGGDFDPRTIWQLRRLATRERADLLCANFDKDVRLGGLAARWAGVPVVVARKGLALLWDRARFRASYVHLVDGILTPCHAIKETFRRFTWLPQKAIHVVHNGVDLEAYSPSISADGVRDALGIPPKSPLIVAAGRLVGQKGYPDLIAATALLRSQLSDLRVLIVGGGKEEARLRAQVETQSLGENVIFTGFRRDVERLVRAGDVFVQASHFEGLPNAVLEAMALGRPVVATDVGGTRELVVEGQTGYLVPARNPQVLADRLAAMLADPARRDAMGAAGRARAEAHFSLEAMVTGTERLFQTLVTGARGAVRLSRSARIAATS